MKISILSPHRDDAAFSLTLAIETWLAAGHTIQIINCFTKSRYAPFLRSASGDDLRDVDFVSKLRREEDQRWSARVGAEIAFVDLHLEDAPLRLNCSVDEVCRLAVSPAERAIDAIQAALQNDTCDAFVIPLAIGRHVDHVTVRLAASIVSTSRAAAFYEDLPYAARPQGMEEIAEYLDDIKIELRPVFTGPPQEPFLAVHRVWVAARAYQSQVDEEAIGQIAEFRSQYYGRERLWANSLWRRSSLMWMNRTEDSTRQ